MLTRLNRIMRTGLTGAFLLLTAACAQHSNTADISGDWSGKAFQVNPNGTSSHWPVRMHIDADGTARIDYPSLKCGGTLTKADAAKNNISYYEEITYGQELCISGGMVSFIPQNGHLFWFWTPDTTSAAQYYASAVLTHAKK